MAQRNFIYNDVTLPDPGAQYDNEQVRQFLASQYFPELNLCETQVGEEQNGKVEIRFVKKVTTKAAESVLLAALQQMSCEAAEAQDEWDIIARFGTAPTIASVLEEQHEDWIADFIDHLQERHCHLPDGNQTLKWSTALPARSLLTLPTGF